MRIIAHIAATGLLLAIAGAGAESRPPGPAGRYRLTGEQDVASELLIKPDGRFSYALIAGALDEKAEGRWRREGDSIFLTTEPKPVPPAFSAGAATHTDSAPLTVKVVWPDGRGVAGADLRVGFAEGDPIEDYTQEDGWSLSSDERRIPIWVEVSLHMFGLPAERFPIDVARANALTFLLTPNDLGTVDFEDMRADLARGRLVLHRGEGRLVYLRVGK
ncbi:MAG TPA: hypothetical protein VF574_06235 [Allosphingosinicella sp.]|jgi:hypothetical protein